MPCSVNITKETPEEAQEHCTSLRGRQGIGGHLRLTELIKDSHPAHLLHLPMEHTDGNAWPKPFEGLVHKADLQSSNRHLA